MAFKTECIVLRSRPWKSADRLYDLFTPAEGVITAVLRSAAKPSSKQAGHLLPFSRVKVMIGRGKMDHLAGVVTLEDFANIRSSLKNISLASTIVELFINEATRGDKTAEFELLKSILRFINDADIQDEKKMLLVRVFLWKYLSIAGWQPELERCMQCGKRIDQGVYTQGRGIICRDHGIVGIGVDTKTLEFLRFIISADWHELVDLEVNNDLNKNWLKLSQHFYQAVFERPSQALKLFIYG